MGVRLAEKNEGRSRSVWRRGGTTAAGVGRPSHSCCRKREDRRSKGDRRIDHKEMDRKGEGERWRSYTERERGKEGERQAKMARQRERETDGEGKRGREIERDAEMTERER